MEAGDVHWAHLPDGGTRPVMILSRPSLNRGDTAWVARITSAHFERRSRLPNCVPFAAGEFGLSRDCVAQCGSAGPVRVDELDARPIGRLSDERLREVVRAVG